MCEFCTQHGDGKIWYKNAANYADDLVSDLRRRKYIEDFLETTIKEGFTALGRLETLFRKKGRLPDSLAAGMVAKAKAEHFGQVLPMEDVGELVLRAEAVVRMPCACRWTAQKKEVRCCYGMSFGPNAWYKDIDMSYFGKDRHEGLESISREEAIAQMERLEDHGAIHTIWTMMTPFIGAVCNCTARDCIAMRTLSGIRVELMARAEYRAVVDEGRCEGCGLCAESCQFGAVDALHGSGKTTASIGAEKCFGCGLCRRLCPAGAISLKPRDKWKNDSP
ncbi:MAG TPA: 4Fe-4S dicluster-binding protein [Dissulfurispiraceae bacterium]